MTSLRGEQYRLQSAMRFDADPIQADLRVNGRPRHFELPPRSPNAAAVRRGGAAGLPACRAGSGARPGGGMILATVSTAAVGLLLFARRHGVPYGVWLLASSSARRSALAERGGIELQPPAPARLNGWRALGARRGGERDLGARLRSAGSERNPATSCCSSSGVALGAFVVVGLLFPWSDRPGRGAGDLGAASPGWADGWRSARRSSSASFPRSRACSPTAPPRRPVDAGRDRARGREIESPARDELQTVVEELRSAARSTRHSRASSAGSLA